MPNRSWTAALVAVLCAAACSPTGPKDNLTGTWLMSGARLYNGNDTQVHFQQQDTVLEGAWVLPDLARAVQLCGTVRGNTVTLELGGDSFFQGTLAGMQIVGLQTVDSTGDSVGHAPMTIGRLSSKNPGPLGLPDCAGFHS